MPLHRAGALLSQSSSTACSQCGSKPVTPDPEPLVLTQGLFLPLKRNKWIFTNGQESKNKTFPALKCFCVPCLTHFFISLTARSLLLQVLNMNSPLPFTSNFFFPTCITVSIKFVFCLFLSEHCVMFVCSHGSIISSPSSSV